MLGEAGGKYLAYFFAACTGNCMCTCVGTCTGTCTSTGIEERTWEDARVQLSIRVDGQLHELDGSAAVDESG